MGVLMGDRRRQFSPEFKRDAVNLVRSSGRPLAQIARELGVGESSLSYWVTKDREQRAAADPKRFATETAESEEIKRLRKRVVELETERESWGRLVRQDRESLEGIGRKLQQHRPQTVHGQLSSPHRFLMLTGQRLDRQAELTDLR
jgi:transposase